jgi:hypothetical protein
VFLLDIFRRELPQSNLRLAELVDADGGLAHSYLLPVDPPVGICLADPPGTRLLGPFENPPVLFCPLWHLRYPRGLLTE